ncbi:MAG: methylenetetrahydrofolate--tRNA-(uracil(54)-C(5))-methyltransferase (FADH(2)-oxidizing) TrmFO [Eubacteriales bacterium]|nr:methylenetetrahydrofolate--tRNA-(uracil(54)-C(5))-methyltransferase (FADH(2)-oxidizing) TrmFO [Eubacteriales bacterium]
MTTICVLGAGLAGSEAAWQLAERGLKVRLIDMKPETLSPAHSDPHFAELVCSNSLRSGKFASASGLLKYELRHFSSLIMEAADATRLPAGGALAVDREAFPLYISERLKQHPNIELVCEQIQDLNDLTDDYRLIATGPLTAGKLFQSIEKFSGADNLYFFDAAAPLIEDSSINKEIAFMASRYEDGEGDYLNCPMDAKQYGEFREALLQADKVVPRGFEKELLFEGCKPIEALAEDGIDTLRFGPLKPVGLPLPGTGEEAYAVVQLRQDDFAHNLWNMVGFQTRLKFPEQVRVFRMIPGLETAEFARFGVMHRNSFICSPRVLSTNYRTLKDQKLFFAGQITGVEGYLESTASGLLAALTLASELGKYDPKLLARASTRETVIGGLANYVISASPDNFQPLKANFSLLSELGREDIRAYRQRYGLKLRGRAERRCYYSIRSLETLGLEADQIKELYQQES